MGVTGTVLLTTLWVVRRTVPVTTKEETENRPLSPSLQGEYLWQEYYCIWLWEIRKRRIQ